MSYHVEDHGDPSVDERWRRALTREDAFNDMENAGFPLSSVSERIQTGGVWDHVHPLYDLYVPEHERAQVPEATIEDVDQLIARIFGWEPL